MRYYFETFIHFLKHVRYGYLVYTSLILVGLIYGGFEIIQKLFFNNIPVAEMRWLYLSRGVISSFLLMTWAAWTVYQYRGIYKERLISIEERYSDIIENSADAIITINNDNVIRTWNNGAELIFGWQKDEIIGKPITVLVPQDLLDMNELRHIESGIKKNGYVRNYETERLTQKGQRILVQLTETQFINEDGKIIGHSQIMRDVTELRIQEKQLRHSERLAAIGHMAAGVAHEVGNPLASISSLVQLVQRRSSDPFVIENLKKVRDNISRITKIVRDLVDFSRPSIARSVPTQLNEVIDSSVGLLKHDARCRDINFKIELDSDLPKVKCVPDHINQVMVNLLLNAVDAVEQSKDKMINIKTTHNNDMVIIEVADKGAGIPEDIRDKIFEPFFTTKDVGSGTGLGLSVSHGIIARMNGSISVESRKNTGTKFKIELPIS